jgi:capsular exopolysaccharide synthesis family protein
VRFDYDPIADREEQALDLTRVLDTLRRRRLGIALATTLALIPALLLAFAKPSYYEATASVSIQGTPKVMELGPDFMPSAPTQSRRGTGAVVALAGSDAVLGRAVDRLPPPRPGSERTSALWGWLQLLGPEPELTAEQQRQLRIDGVRRSVELGMEGGGTILKVSASAQDPGFATALANLVADSFVDFRRSQREAASRRAMSWLGERVLDLRAQIEREEEAIAVLLVTTGIVPSREEAGQSEARLKQDLVTARIELLVTEARLAELGAADPVRSSLDAANLEGRVLLQEQYARASADLEAARLRFTPTHPELERLEEVVDRLRTRLSPELDSGSNPGFAAEREALRSQGSSLRARVNVLERALEELSDESRPGSQAVAAYERRERELSIDREMLGVLLRRRNETLLAAATEHPDARTLDRAVAPVHPAGPNRRKRVVFGIAMALGFGFGLGLLREMLDHRVRDPEQAERILDVPFLGVIPRTRNGIPPEEQIREGYAAPASESYRNLRTALLFSANGSGAASTLGTLVITSGVAGEGKTTVSANVAESFAHLGRKVLLVDADLRRSRVHRILGLEREPGLTELLRGELGLHSVVQQTARADFDVITSGAVCRRPAELLSSNLFGLFLSRMKESYELIVLDSPVLLAVPDALLLAAKADSTFIVQEPGRLEATALARMRVDLERAKARVLGFAFNRVEPGDRYLYPGYLRSGYAPPPDLA